MTGLKESPLVPGLAALLFVDLQNYNCQRGGALYKQYAREQLEVISPPKLPSYPRPTPRRRSRRLLASAEMRPQRWLFIVMTNTLRRLGSRSWRPCWRRTRPSYREASARPRSARRSSHHRGPHPIAGPRLPVFLEPNPGGDARVAEAAGDGAGGGCVQTAGLDPGGAPADPGADVALPAYSGALKLDTRTNARSLRRLGFDGRPPCAGQRRRCLLRAPPSARAATRRCSSLPFLPARRPRVSPAPSFFPPPAALPDQVSRSFTPSTRA